MQPVPILATTQAYCPWIHLADTEARTPWEKLHRTLAHYLLVVNYEGVEDLVVQGERIDIPQGSAYIIQPGVLAERLGSQKGNRPAYIHFDVMFNEHREEHRNTGSYDDLTGREHLLQPNAQEVWGVDLPVRVPKAVLPLFVRTVDPMIQRWRTGRPLDQMAANYDLQGLLHAFVHHEARRNPDANTSVDPETRIKLAEAAAHVRMSRPFGVDDFARAARLGRTQFSKLFHELRGKSPGKALKDMRLDEAERLLMSSNLSVQEVGRQVGYPNPTVLGRCFRERHGLTPSEWRSRLGR